MTRRDGVTSLLMTLVMVLCYTLCLVQQSATQSNQWKRKFEPKLQPQPDDIASGKYDDLRFDDGWICTRECRPDDPRICYYNWMIEPYTTLNRACGSCPNVTSDCFLPQCVTADGFEKPILTVNRRLPGPSIQVCKGDTVIVDVVNKMPGRSTSIHWHGLLQKGTPWMDGVPFVTQCPIHESDTFRYRFRADDSGTNFWHSHDGLQKVDGILGSFVVRVPDCENPLRNFYDFDLPSHVIVIEDWLHTAADDRLPGYFRTQSLKGQGPVSYLINGRGTQVVNKTELVGNFPLSEFKVRQGYRYRFRLVGGSCLSCPNRLTIQDHKLLGIATDRSPIKPVLFDSVVLSAGERYDVVIEAIRPIDAYYILVEGLGDCSRRSQVAVLRYEGGPSRPSVPLREAFPDIEAGYMLNAYNAACNYSSLAVGRCISQLSGLERTPPEVLRPAPDFRFLFTFNFYSFTDEELFYSDTYNSYFVVPDNTHLAGQMNNKSYINPPAPLLTQYHDIPPEVFCSNADCVSDGSQICKCTHVIHVPLHSVVEFMFVHAEPPSIVMLSHPFHIHGYDYYVVEEGKLPNKYNSPEGMAFVWRKLNENRYNLSPFLPSKDTVSPGLIFFTVFSELFSSKSPNNVYSKALEKVCSDTRVQDALGGPISGYGEEDRRGRRRHVSHLLYEKDGEKRLRMKFYVNGSRKRATVHLEMKEDESGNYVYRYLFVELDDFGRHPIVLEDNRNSQPQQQQQLLQPSFKHSNELDLSQPLNMNLNFPDAGIK